jgi:hypothetical protein
MNSVEALEARRLLSTTFFISPSGSDSNAANDPSHPWQTIAKLDATTFQAGDQILFQTAQTFGGNLTFGTDDKGTSAAPVIVNTYLYDPTTGTVTIGTGKATINAGNNNGILATNTAGLDINNLNVIGAGQAANTFNGIQFNNNLSGNVQLPYVHIDSVSVSGFGKFGITVGGSNGKSGFSDIRISNSVSFNNVVGGIETHGVFSSTATTYANSNVTVDHCTVHDNPGYAGASNHTGDGIVISDVNNSNFPTAAIQRNVAYNNGAQNTHVGGPVGIWSWDSNAVSIQYNESYNNQTNSTADGGGFDLDGGDTNCVLQYNYSHGNAGAGYGLFQFKGARPWGNNTVRYNVSENDGRKNGYGAITVWGYNSTSLQNAEIYNNTVYVSPSGSGSPMAVYIESGTQNVHFRDNIFQVSGGLQLAYIKGTQTGLLFQGNDYWSSGGAFSLKQFTKTYTSLAAWQKGTGQELLSGNPVGLNVNPLLNNPGGGGTIGNADNLYTLSAYQLQSTSPLKNVALNLTQFGINSGLTDFFGNPIPDPSGLFDIGANEAA